MSWSIGATGSPAEVKAALDRQFKLPLDEINGLSDAGERETVRKVQETIYQVLDTFGPERTVAVSANGHMGFANWDAKENPYQNVFLSIGTTT